jgi:AraC-like DNA-binding protein
LREFLLSLVPEGADNTVIELGMNPTLAEGKFRTRVSSVEDLAAASERHRPRVAVISGMDFPVLSAVLANPDLADSTLFWASDRLADAREEAALCARPRSIAYNTGILFQDAFRQAVERTAGGEEPLPAATGALIIKSVFFLNRHFRESITRWRLSDCVNASEDYLSRIFRKQMGISLWDYLSRLRIGYALELLRTTGESVNEIASRAGFQDQAYFCRVFRRVTGSTPGQSRKGT